MQRPTTTEVYAALAERLAVPLPGVRWAGHVLQRVGMLPMGGPGRGGARAAALDLRHIVDLLLAVVASPARTWGAETAQAYRPLPFRGVRVRHAAVAHAEEWLLPPADVDTVGTIHGLPDPLREQLQLPLGPMLENLIGQSQAITPAAREFQPFALEFARSIEKPRATLHCSAHSAVAGGALHVALCYSSDSLAEVPQGIRGVELRAVAPGSVLTRLGELVAATPAESRQVTDQLLDQARAAPAAH